MTNGKSITIEPVTRVEGHGKVTIQLDNEGRVADSRFHIVEFRGFERFVQGRPYWEAPVLVQRLCGICPVSHHLAAAKAMDMVVGLGEEGLTPTGEKMRRLMHYGQMFQSHALHFFYLASPDLLFGPDADAAKRNVLAVAEENRELALQGIKMRKFGQMIIEATSGKRIHGTGAVPGGINRVLDAETVKSFLSGEEGIDIMIQWAHGAVKFLKDYHSKNRDFIDNYATFPSAYLSLVREDGALDFYHGRLRAVGPDGERLLDDIDYAEYRDYIGEDVKDWSYMKFPYLKSLGPRDGWYTVGPLGRLNTVDFIPSDIAGQEFEEFRAYNDGKPHHQSMHMHWARLIELLHSAEVMKDLLNDPDIQKGELTAKGTKQDHGVGLVEAPRGTLFHEYRIDENDLVTMANLIVSTTNNNEPMNRAVRAVADREIDGKGEVTEGTLNMVEMAIRAYDPCLSCATHAIGRMPLECSVLNENGEEIALFHQNMGG